MRINSIIGYSIPSIGKNTNAKYINYQKIQGLKSDTVSFSSILDKKKNVNVNMDIAMQVANSLSKSTSGHRAPYGGKTFNRDVVRLITLATAEYAKDEASKNNKLPTVLIGGDTRKATRESLPLISDTLLKQNVNVLYIKEPMPSPLIAMTAKDLGADITILMTASHNPWSDGGYNFLTKDGAVAPAEITQKISDNILSIAQKGIYSEVRNSSAKEVEIHPIESYASAIENMNLINWDKIRNSNILISYDGLDGTGSYVLPEMLRNHEIHFNQIHSSGQEGPNPTSENLIELKKLVVETDDNELKIGLANDGDADRFGIIDENGNFITPNDVLLLVSYHLAKNKGITGTIIRSQATTKELDSVAQLYGFDIKETPVGFKFIGDDILKLREQGSDILIAGEESGGLTINGHIPEKDGVLADLLILDLIATEQKPISKILEDVKSELPNYISISHFSKKYPTDDDKQCIMDRFNDIYKEAQKGNINFDSDYTIDIEKTNEQQKLMKQYKKQGDGVKLYLTDGSTILVRKSGTEPLLRCYIEASGNTKQDAQENKMKLQEIMDGIFTL